MFNELNCDCPILARVKYLCDFGFDNCNPVCLCVTVGGLETETLCKKDCKNLKNQISFQQEMMVGDLAISWWKHYASQKALSAS